jgi:flavin reductase (DIM6/NTAB) family NADH-FMN oxidoreductase RutF
MKPAKDLRAELRDVLRGAAATVYVVATADASTRIAMTATAVAPVSLDPPTLLVCVNRSAEIHPTLAGGAGFTLSLLRPGQEEISNRCGGAVTGEERFAIGDWQTDRTGLPFLADAAASMGCRQVQIVSQGSHDIVIGEVTWVRHGGVVDPLVHLDGGYWNPKASR